MAFRGHKVFRVLPVLAALWGLLVALVQLEQLVVRVLLDLVLRVLQAHREQLALVDPLVLLALA
jgi:hypothetical protein